LTKEDSGGFEKIENKDNEVVEDLNNI